MATIAASVRAQVDVRCLRDPCDFDEATKLLWKVWDAQTTRSQVEVIGKSVLRSLAASGNFVAGAYHGGKLVGCCVAWLGCEDVDSDDPPARQQYLHSRQQYLHSHLLAVLPAMRRRGIGFRLKQFQRDWALKRGITMIQWTFDPQLRGNAVFNLCRLGATVTQFIPGCYGKIKDGTNDGKSTDRLLVEWVLDSERVKDAMKGKPAMVTEAALTAPGVRLVEVPDDADSTQAGLQVRRRLRKLIRRRGYRLAGITRNGIYVLLPPTGSTEG